MRVLPITLGQWPTRVEVCLRTGEAGSVRQVVMEKLALAQDLVLVPNSCEPLLQPRQDVDLWDARARTISEVQPKQRVGSQRNAVVSGREV